MSGNVWDEVTDKLSRNIWATFKTMALSGTCGLIPLLGVQQLTAAGLSSSERKIHPIFTC